MKGEERILQVFERNAKAHSLRPTLGQGTATTRVRLAEGYLCEAQDGSWSLKVDMSEKSGGTGSAPDPGVYGRTALGSCSTITYAAWAAKLGIQVSSLEVEVQTDYDSDGFHGLGEAQQLTLEAAGFSDVTTERISTSLQYETAADALGAAFAGGPVALAYSRFDDQTRDEAHSEYLASIAPYRDGDSYQIPGEFVVTCGFRL